MAGLFIKFLEKIFFGRKVPLYDKHEKTESQETLSIQNLMLYGQFTNLPLTQPKQSKVHIEQSNSSIKPHNSTDCDLYDNAPTSGSTKAIAKRFSGNAFVRSAFRQSFGLLRRVLDCAAQRRTCYISSTRHSAKVYLVRFLLYLHLQVLCDIIILL